MEYVSAGILDPSHKLTNTLPCSFAIFVIVMMPPDNVKVLILCQAPRECFKSINLINVLNHQDTLKR